MNLRERMALSYLVPFPYKGSPELNGLKKGTQHIQQSPFHYPCQATSYHSLSTWALSQMQQVIETNNKNQKNEQTNKPLSNLRDHTPSWFMSATLLLLDFRLILEQSIGEVTTALDLAKPIHLLSEALCGDLEGTLMLWSEK